MIHPAVNLAEGHRYLVVLRHLRRADGTVIASCADAFPCTGGPAYAAHLRDVVARARRWASGRPGSTPPGTSPWPAPATSRPGPGHAG